MLSRFFRQLFASVGVVFRTIRAYFTRTLTGATARFRSATSLTRQAAQLGPAMMKTAANAGKKPTKREDYIETEQMFISKSFLIMAVALILALAVLFYWVGWPWLVSRFFTAKMWVEDPDAADYSGKVILYHEEDKQTVRFEGRLEEGVIQGKGKAFDEHGLLVYSGDFVDGVYHGEGTLAADGALLYEGDFAEGRYEGEGKLYGASERLLYDGTFVDGLYDGKGKLYGPGESLLYDGTFAAGLRTGEGTAYEGGKKRYKGTFEHDLYHGTGTLYEKDGSVLYEGAFAEGLYHGEGTLSLGNGITVKAAFEQGEVLGVARFLQNGKVYYEGDAANLLPEGMGTLYGSVGIALYTGRMRSGAVVGGKLLGLSANDIREL
ncbi:MAG: hypothetical protein IJC43_01770, partial [Clostridia bacterium]|nr:hypothetical protein [Clostridia bacterium]